MGTHKLFSMCDPWREMMIEISGPAGMQLSLDRLLEGADGPVKADRDILDGRPCVRLRFSQAYPGGAKYQITLWHDIGYNYLIRQMIAENLDRSQSRGVCRVTDFVEPEPGVVLPVRVKREHYRGGELNQVTVASLTDVVINKPIPAAQLALPPIPSGIEFRDYIAGRIGVIDSNWSPIGPMKALPPPLLKLGTADPAAPDAAPSTAEPTSTARWVMLGSIAALVLALGLAVVGRLRRRRGPLAA